MLIKGSYKHCYRIWKAHILAGMLVGGTAATGTGTGPASGNTLGPGGNVTGATSNATAQVGPDGCLTEPSRKERRAQALHKYKQKRKVSHSERFLLFLSHSV